MAASIAEPPDKEEENRICELNARIYSLEQTVSKQREDIRSLEKELSAKTTDTEVLQAHLEHLTRINEDHRRRSSLIQRQAQQLVEDKADLQAVLHDKDLEVSRIRSQLHRLSGLGDPTAFNSVPVGASNVEDFNPKGIEIQRKVDAPVTVLDDYKPDSAVVDQGETLVNEEERDPPVQGPINREPDEKLYPRSRVNKESGIRKLFKHFLDRLEKLKFSEDEDEQQ